MASSCFKRKCPETCSGLARLEARLHLGLPVQDLVKITRQTAIEHESRREFQVTFKGTKVLLEYRIFMDDVDSPDLYFFTSSKELAHAIDKQLASFAEDHGL